MRFGDILGGDSVFIDANTLVYHFEPHPSYGSACTALIERIELQEIFGFTSTHVLSEVAHRLMALESMRRFNWPATGIAQRLRKHTATHRFPSGSGIDPQTWYSGAFNRSSDDRHGRVGQSTNRFAK